MIERLRNHYAIRDTRVLDAMRAVPRHQFVPEALQGRAYGDHALPIAANQTISQPFIVAGGPDVPEPLLAQLKVDGRLVIPVGDTREAQRLVRVIRTEKGYTREDHGACAFVPLIGHYGWTT